MVFVGDAVQGSGDGGVAVCAGRQGEAQERGMNIRPDTGDPGRVQAVEEVAAGVAGIGVHEVDETQVLPQADGKVRVAKVVGEHARLLKVRPSRPKLPRGELVDAEVGQRDGEPVVVSGRPGQGEGFLVVSEGGVQIARLALEHRTTAKKVSNQPGISGCPGQPDGFVDLGPRGRQIAMLEPEPAQLRQGIGGDGVIGEVTGDLDGLAGQRRDRRVVAEVIEQVAARGEGPGPGPGGHAGVGSLEQDVERLEDFAGVAAHVAEPAQPRRQSQAGLGTAGIGDAERQCGADVVELDLEPVEPDGLVRAAQVRAGGLDQGQVVIAVGGAGFVQLGAGPQGEAFSGVLADRLQQPVAGRTLDLFGLDQALVDQGGQMVQHLPFSGAASAEVTASAASRVQPPAKTDSRSSTIRSSGLSRS